MESIPEPMSTWESSFTQAAEALTGLVKASYHQNHLEILIQRNQIKEIVFSLFPANNRSKQSIYRTSREWTEAGKVNMMPSYLSIGVLQEFGRRCNSKVVSKFVVSIFKDAQWQAAENALYVLADKYVAYITPHSGAGDKDFDKLSLSNENGSLWDTTSAGSNDLVTEDGLPKETISEAGKMAHGTASSRKREKFLKVIDLVSKHTLEDTEI